MVASLADQQQDSQTPFRLLLQQIYRVVHRVEDYGPAISRLEIGEIGGDQTRVPREISDAIHLTVEFDHGDSRSSPAEQRVAHRLQSLDARTLALSAAAALEAACQAV